MNAVVFQIDPWLVSLLLAAAMTGGWALGWAIGRKRPTDPEDKPTARFVDGCMAFLGLFLAFSFAVALEKHEQRRLLTVADCNSIGDFYTCASLLPEPYRTDLQDTVRQYVDIRLRLIRGKPDRAMVEQALAESSRLHQRLTSLTAGAVSAGTPVTVPLVNTLNGLTSSHASLVAAMRDRLAAEVLLLLMAAAIISTVLVGRHHGAGNRAYVAGTLSYVLLVALAVGVVLDLNHPAKGLVKAHHEPFERLAESIAK